MDYSRFLSSKKLRAEPSGHDPAALPDVLMDFQSAIVRWAVRQGRAAIFADTGLGKTLMQLAWAFECPGKVLILAPLAVGRQTAAEARNLLGMRVDVVRDQDGVEECASDGCMVFVSNYERAHLFDPEAFRGVVLDESSILKSIDGKTRAHLTEAFRATPYRLCCTATPAPNDWTELGQQAAFLGMMTRGEMLSRWFVHDGGSTQNWRLKGHARDDFWEWVCSWSVLVRNPRDIGFDGNSFDLPPLAIEEHIIEASARMPGQLFDVGEGFGLAERRHARRTSLDKRVAEVAAKVNASSEPWLVFCDLNDEGDALARMIPDAVQVAGRDSPEAKADAMTRFSDGDVRVLVSKPKICGFGMNWQHCARIAFCGLSDSYEAFYQAVRRCWRFGQTRPVEVHVVLSSAETPILDNVKRKEASVQKMARQVADVTNDGVIRNLKEGKTMGRTEIDRETTSGEGWTMHHGDCVDVLKDMPAESVGYSIFSPPFASLYTYTDMAEDMGNTASESEFLEHFGFLIPELLRVTKPGRLLSFHCMLLPTLKSRDGYVGLRDFRGDLIRAFVDAGWIYHSEVCIWKDPVMAMQRTKALGLLHKQLKKDSAMSRQGIPDYVVTMRKPGSNPVPVSHTNESFPVAEWQQYASPIWTDIDPGDTLQASSARAHDDERHICPLQLEVIRRCLRLWTTEGDLVLSPFAGIGSEGFESVKHGRRFVGVELKSSYFDQACANLARAVVESRQNVLFP